MSQLSIKLLQALLAQYIYYTDSSNYVITFAELYRYELMYT